MPYTRRHWLNRPNPTTPMSAAALNNIEDGIEEALAGVETLGTDVESRIPATAKGAASGVAELDGDSLVPLAQVPVQAIADDPILTSTIVSVLGNEAPAVVEPLVAAGLTGVTVGSLKRWHQRLADDPSTAKVAFVGDSTTEGATDLFTVLRTYYTARGRSLAGVPSANIIQGGNNGWSLRAWLDNAAGANDAPYALSDLTADQPDLIVPCFGINDVRQGGVSLATMTARLIELVDLLTEQLPDADILLRMPNSLTTTVVGTDYVDGITHQAATDLLRQAYLSLSGKWPHVVVADTQAEVFGTTALPLSVLMYDELHPSVAGYRATAHFFGTKLLGPTPDRVSIGPQASYRFQREGYIIAAGSGYFDIGTLPGRTDLPNPREWPLTTSDVVVVNGYGTFSLSGATFGTSGGALRILKTGDWTSLVGAQVQVSGSHPDLGASEGRYFATIDPGSVAAGGYLDVTYTLNGVTREMGVVVQPPSTIWATGLILTYGISADNTLTLRFYNPTASAIDLGGNAGWRIWVLR